MFDRTVSIAIIGCGSYGIEHARCLQQVEGARIVACCDQDGTKAEALAAMVAAPRWLTDAGEVMTDPSVDAIYIVTRHDSHANLAVSAARAGKHIFMEKPLALTRDECLRVMEAVEGAGVFFMMGFKFRFYPAVAALREFIPKPRLTIAHGLDQRWPDDFWANDPIAGGGNVLSEGCHVMDLVCHLHHGNPVRISAEGGNYSHPGVDIIDTMSANITFEDGSIASVVLADAGLPPFVSKFSFQLFDGERSADLHNRLKSLSLSDGASVTAHHDEEELGVMEENRAFVRSILDGAASPVPVRDGYRATLLTLCGLESIRSGLPVSIPSSA